MMLDNIVWLHCSLAPSFWTVVLVKHLPCIFKPLSASHRACVPPSGQLVLSSVYFQWEDLRLTTAVFLV